MWRGGAGGLRWRKKNRETQLSAQAPQVWIAGINIPESGPGRGVREMVAPSRPMMLPGLAARGPEATPAPASASPTTWSVRCLRMQVLMAFAHWASA
jgi:hypothetical protein